MKARQLFPIVLVFLFDAVVHSSVCCQTSGYIQVKSPPGVQIFLDGDFKGNTTQELGGLILQGVPTGHHTIKAAKAGFTSQQASFLLKRDEVFLFTVRPFAPNVEIREEGVEDAGSIEAKVGALLVQSLPVECRISIPSVGIKDAAKSQDKWTVSKLPEGRHSVVLYAMGKTLRWEGEILPDKTRRIMVNFLSGRIEESTSDEDEEDRTSTPHAAATGSKVAGVQTSVEDREVTYQTLLRLFGKPIEAAERLIGPADHKYPDFYVWCERFGGKYDQPGQLSMKVTFDGADGNKINELTFTNINVSGEAPLGLRPGMLYAEAIAVCSKNFGEMRKGDLYASFSKPTQGNFLSSVTLWRSGTGRNAIVWELELGKWDH
jgi:hypothetical protein